MLHLDYLLLRFGLLCRLLRFCLDVPEEEVFSDFRGSHEVVYELNTLFMHALHELGLRLLGRGLIVTLLSRGLSLLGTLILGYRLVLDHLEHFEHRVVIVIDGVGRQDEDANKFKHLLKEVLLKLRDLVDFLARDYLEGLVEHLKDLLETFETHEPLDPVKLKGFFLRVDSICFVLFMHLGAFFKQSLNHLQDIEHLVKTLRIEDLRPLETWVSVQDKNLLE